MTGTRRRAARGGDWASIRDLEVFVALVESGKATAAAARLAISQPAVSRTMALLEERSGLKLFERKDLGLAPTADALRLFEEVRPILEGLQRVRELRWTAPARSTLRVSVPPTLAHCLVEPLLPSFRKAHPDVTVSLDIITSQAVIESVSAQRADLGIAELPDTHPGTRRLPFRYSVLVCVLPRAHRLARRPVIGVRELDGERLIAFTKRHVVRGMFDRLLAKAGAAPLLAAETSNALSAVRLAAGGLGVAVVSPFPATLALPRGLVLRRLDPALRFETSFYVQAGGAPFVAAQRFMDFLRAHQPPASAVSQPIG